MIKLTKRAIDGLSSKEKDRIIFDTELKGFGLRISPRGLKTFIVQYRAGGRTRRIKLGTYGRLTAEEARKLAKSTLGAVALGDNPAEKIRIERRAPTMNALCDRFMKEHVEERLKPTTRREYGRCIDLFIRPAIGSFKIADVERSDIANLHHDLRDKPYQANRVLGVLSKLFNTAEMWGLRSEGSNPTRLVTKYKERKRERFLTADELKRLNNILSVREAEGLETPHIVAAFRLLTLTGCRLTEIQTLKWQYVHDGYIWLPDSKTGERRVPLPEAACAILNVLPRQLDNDYVIAGNKPGTYATDLQKPWRRIRKAADLEDVRIHDLRHNYASAAVRKGLSLPVVGRILGHSQIATTMRYAHFADDHIREAATNVSDELAGMMSQS